MVDERRLDGGSSELYNYNRCAQNPRRDSKNLVSHGARKLMYDFDEEGRVQAMCFTIMTPAGERAVRLPANVPAIYEVLKEQKRSGKIKTNSDYAQAERVAWRILKDWVEAQMAILESRMVYFEEIFLPYIINKQGQTFFQLYKQNLLAEKNDEE
jgi:Tfp pilus assembly pilus retraction ATPase PilT